MNVSNSTNHVIASIEKLNQMLLMISGAAANMEDKIVKHTAARNIEGLGDTIDTRV